MHLSDKKIVLGISGSIAAYKTPELVRQLVKAGAEVQVICTDAAASFVSPLSLATVSGKKVLHNISEGDSWNNHVALGYWADMILIAPCSANTLAKLANGICDNLLCAVYLSARAPVCIAPAMDEDMWHHASTRNNLLKLESFGNTIIPVGYGALASGLTGEGRMAEPAEIVQFLSRMLNKEQPLAGKKALVTAGPTYERIDPVRFIGNFSTGKMGIALAESLARQGASVQLILGPTHLRPSGKQIKVTLVESASEMFEHTKAAFGETDIAVLSAAVADYRAAEIADQKIKKKGETLTITLEKNKDILAYLGSVKRKDQVLVGFALETENEIENAARKRVEKKADFIILNSLNDKGAGFGTDTNKVSILSPDGITELPLLPKADTADAIVTAITQTLTNHAT
ncbi:MAG: bifunctional phosphopantothenoylcysteine decarboxylase/phosphopantothenate--cysteine ligase CoaBC [Chitinophagaceae bacterium]